MPTILLVLTQALLIGLKIGATITMSWWLVLLPLWVFLAVVLMAFVAFLVVLRVNG